MSAETLVLFALASLVLNVTPGPDMLYCVCRAGVQGSRAGIAAAIGNLAGSLVHTAFAVIGLSALLAASSSAFMVVKLAGAGYLVYLGVRTILRTPGNPGDDPRPTATYRRIAAESFLIHTLNPKTAVFFLAFLPQFVDAAAPSPALQLVVLGLWFTGQAALVLALIGTVAHAAGSRLRVGGRLARWLRRATGGVFIAFGARLAAAAVR